MPNGHKPDPCSFVIFGATGDLAHRLVIPALYNLLAGNLLPDNFCVVGIARKGMTSEQLSESLMKGLHQFSARKIDDTLANKLLSCVTCIEADPKDPASMDAMSRQLDKLEAERKTGGNRLFYLATPPNAFLPIAEGLARTGMLSENGAWRRIIIEKPFGTDLESAKHLNHELLKLMDEQQIYRIDHYLGKETVQNILVLRFANGMFEPIWNRNHIDHIQITVDEKLGVGHRGSFYDATGALRDMVPNHLMELLSLIAMEPPVSFSVDHMRAKQVELLESVRHIRPRAVSRYPPDVSHYAVRGQYSAGKVGKQAVPAYRREQGVSPRSQTETYVALKLEIDNWRWSGVPFFLRTGKRLTNSVTEIAVQFRPAPARLFPKVAADTAAPNTMVFAMKPKQGIDMAFCARAPGLENQVMAGDMAFEFPAGPFGKDPKGYERPLHDAMLGDPILFPSAAFIELGWKLVQPLLDAWSPEKRAAVPKYAAGSQGPREADHLLAQSGHKWRVLR